VAFFLLIFGAYCVYAWTALKVVEDPLVRMPGTQPGQVALESAGRCLNCHAGYNPSVEPGYNWKGSMMAQAARDPLFWACFTVALQDSLWAVGTPNAGDLCERCHFPAGWLEGRSDPPNASAMIGSDFDALHCDFCHTMFDPFFEETYAGDREGSDWLNYWDETNQSDTPSQQEADLTYNEDILQAQNILLFNGSAFYDPNNLPISPDYTENASGQFFISAGSQKRASFADAAARHQMLYSRYHKSRFFCATCHDVSNPILANLGADVTQPLPTERNSAHSYYHVERTFSEFMLSDYSQAQGTPGKGPFAPNLYETSHPDNLIGRCQDCHMRDVIGRACNKKGVPVRPTDSIEHPGSGQPLHDLTGGNAWISYILASTVGGSPNYDSFNDQLLNRGPAVLTLDLTQGEGIDPAALLAGAERAKQQLQLAASIEDLNYNSTTGELSFRIQNNTGHKLISGFPEGRRIFVNIKAYDAGELIYEVNPYDSNAGTLKDLDYHYQPDPILPLPEDLNDAETHIDELVYEMHPMSALTWEDETFHFALATDRYKDNRIPPKGFRIGQATTRLVQPRWHGADAPGYFTAAEYTGGYDDVSLANYGISIPGADLVEVSLYYQTTSREYIEFLRDEINKTGNLTLYGPDNPLTTPDGTLHNQTFATENGLNLDPNDAYLIQDDPFFERLKAWGTTIWDLWTHNMNVPGGAPLLMAQATSGTPPQACTAPAPELLQAEPGHQQVTLLWTDESGDPNVAGYRVYYDQAGKAQLVHDTVDDLNRLTTTFVDTGLTNGLEYCYKVTSYYDPNCESSFSDVVCVIPENQGQTSDTAGVSEIITGLYVGKGKARTFNLQSTFVPGDSVVILAYVVDNVTGLPIADAVVELLITGPEGTTLTTAPSDAGGVAEASWQTKSPGRKNPGTTPGTYTVQTKNVTAAGYTWDGVTTSTTFIIE
jgi:hypothetical protein